MDGDEEFDCEGFGDDMGPDWEFDDADMQEEEDLWEDGLDDERPGILWALLKPRKTTI
jgi:hypothetical protein